MFFLTFSLNIYSQDEGLKVSDYEKGWVRLKLDGDSFLKNKTFTYYRIDSNDRKTCYKITTDKNLNYVMTGDGITLKGKLTKAPTKLIFSVVSSAAGGTILPKSPDMELSFKNKYDLWRHEKSGPDYRPGAYTLDLESSSKVDVIYTQCHLDPICSRFCN